MYNLILKALSAMTGLFIVKPLNNERDDLLTKGNFYLLRRTYEPWRQIGFTKKEKRLFTGIVGGACWSITENYSTIREG
ncbi:hypothetical protein SanaruYs_12450 [Chryseotalea sanaruensis]|uniref:Uncharacterized protein n=1 Tax=Chryseotalea sanaruensis TaxID=2482724 RepID=A0A401U827_9BACT|nr:hypothetical protein SanaruYs_12450 [Chryseotalea sanaruensis]